MVRTDTRKKSLKEVSYKKEGRRVSLGIPALPHLFHFTVAIKFRVKKQKKMNTRLLVLLIVSTISISPLHVVVSSSQGTHTNPHLESTSPFSLALETLEKQVRYNFNHINLLRRAMTHSSYSGENNRALSILGLNVIETSVSLRSLDRDIDVSPEDLSRKIEEVTKVDSCAVDGSKFGLEKIVRVSSKMNSSTPSIVCGAFRAIFGAIALDSGKADVAGDVFWNVTTHSHRTGGYFAM